MNIKPVYILNLVLAAAVVFLAVKLATGSSSSSAEDAVLENIATRTSIRKYQDKPVEKEKIKKLLEAAMAAPSAMNKQPWHFIVVTDKNILASIAKANHNSEMAAHAPLAIVVCGDTDKSIPGRPAGYWVQDASAASENILLAAHAMGLGAVWTGTYPMPERVAPITKILGLPKNIIPLNTIVIGYPAENPQPKDKFKEENISYNSYAGKEAE